MARLVLNFQDCLYLGNLDAKRDWGHAKDYVRAMWLMLHQREPDDYVIAIGIEIGFSGRGAAEVGSVLNCYDTEFHMDKGKTAIKIDPTYHRPTEVDLLCGDAEKCKEKLGWKPEYDLKE